MVVTLKNRILAICSMLIAGTLFAGCADKGNTEKTAAEAVYASVEETTMSVENAEATTQNTEENTTEVSSEEVSEEQAQLPDGVYTADFTTDSSMFHVSEACDGKGTLTVENGKMTIHISLGSKKIVNLYPGLADDAEKGGAELLQPTEDTVTYSDGMTEEVYGYDVPVPYLDKEFDLALIGTKGVWYDHKVSVSNPEPVGEETESEDTTGTEIAANLEDGTYSVELTFEGGSGKAQILSPATITVSGETVTATLEWSSPNYDYMIVDNEKYLPVNTEGNSVFEITVSAFDEELNVIGDTVAMSKPHEVEYTVTFHYDTIKQIEE